MRLWIFFKSLLLLCGVGKFRVTTRPLLISPWLRAGAPCSCSPCGLHWHHGAGVKAPAPPLDLLCHPNRGLGWGDHTTAKQGRKSRLSTRSLRTGWHWGHGFSMVFGNWCIKVLCLYRLPFLVLWLKSWLLASVVCSHWYFWAAHSTHTLRYVGKSKQSTPPTTKQQQQTSGNSLLCYFQGPRPICILLFIFQNCLIFILYVSRALSCTYWEESQGKAYLLHLSPPALFWIMNFLKMSLKVALSTLSL